jgi:5-methylthioadenosine/S-adenosylhomocysteine deaminase
VWIHAPYGCGQVEFLERLGMVGEGVVLVHCSAMNAEEAVELTGSGTSVVHCPASPAKMGSGVTPVRELLDAGINVCLGTDAAAANNGADLIRDLKWVAYLQKLLQRDPTVVTAEQVLELATIGGARALLLAHLTGSLEVGKRADFIVVRTDGPGWVPTLNPVANLVYSTTGADVDTVVVGGKVLMEGRTLTTLDEERILAEARDAVVDLYRRTGVATPSTWPVT